MKYDHRSSQRALKCLVVVFPVLSRLWVDCRCEVRQSWVAGLAPCSVESRSCRLKRRQSVVSASGRRVSESSVSGLSMRSSSVLSRLWVDCRCEVRQSTVAGLVPCSVESRSCRLKLSQVGPLCNLAGLLCLFKPPSSYSDCVVTVSSVTAVCEAWLI